MKKNLTKSYLFGNILSDGSFCFLSLSNSYLSDSLNFKHSDVLNHSVWTGQRVKKQTEISIFIDRIVNK